MKYNIGNRVKIINGNTFHTNFGEAKIPEEMIVHGEPHNSNSEGIIISIYKEYYLVQQIGRKEILGYTENNLELVENEEQELIYQVY